MTIFGDRIVFFRFLYSPKSIELCSCRNVGINHKQVKSFFVVFMVNGGNKHSAGFNAHHRARRKVYYRDTGLAHKVFGFIVSVNARKNGALGARAVVKSEFEQFFGLGNGFARKHFNRAEIGFRESLKINGVLKQRLYLNFGKVYFLFDNGRGLCGCRGLFGLLVRVKRFERGDDLGHRFNSCYNPT